MSPPKKSTTNGNGNGKGGANNGNRKPLDEPRWVQLTQLFGAGAWAMSEEDRNKVVQALSKPVRQAKPGSLGEQEPIAWWEEAIAVVFLFVFLGAMCVRGCGCVRAF